MEKITLLLYSSLLAVALPLVSPILLFVPKTRAGLIQKLGIIDEPLRLSLLDFKGAIWIHAVSVGEFNGVFPLIQALKDKYNHLPLIVSTTTQAGQKLAKQRLCNIAQVIYFPFDLAWIVNRFISLLEPSLVIIFETELWPNFIDACWYANIPVAVLNARMSPRSFKRYKAAKWFFGPILRKLALIGAQTNKEADQYQAIAGDKLPIKVFGNLKYDWPALLDNQAIITLKNKLGIESDDLVLVAGSTHSEEERTILDLYSKFISNAQIHKGRTLRLIIAPRHPERFEAVVRIIEKAGFSAKRFSQNEKLTATNQIYLLDTIGQLANFYSIASLAFVGGTIAKVGGHNLLEPYLYGVPVVCGPHLFKTKETAAILNKEEALFIGSDIHAVQSLIIQLIQDQDLREKMGKKGQLWLNNNRGAVARSIEAIADILAINLNDNIGSTKTSKMEIMS